MSSKFQITGLKETLQVFQDLENEIGDKKARSKVLIPAVKEAMKPVLAMAKGSAPYDNSSNHSGVHLRDTLTIVGRKPTKNDKKSRYVTQTDTVIAIVTTKPIPKKLKKQTVGMNKKERKNFYTASGVIYDGRAVANEFGTAKMAGHPFMRPALESQVLTVSARLGEILKQKIEQYKAKNI